MQREDVERLCAPIEKIVNYEYSSRDALIHNCDLGAIDMGQLQDLCAALRALLDRAEKAEAMAQRSACEAVSALGQAHEAHEARLQAEAALARPSAPETLAWAVVGEDGKAQLDTFTTSEALTREWWCKPGERVVRVAIRVVEDRPTSAASQTGPTAACRDQSLP